MQGQGYEDLPPCRDKAMRIQGRPCMPIDFNGADARPAYENLYRFTIFCEGTNRVYTIEIDGADTRPALYPHHCGL